MSDDKAAEANAQSAEQSAAKHPEPKVWSDDEVKKIIEERDKAKSKLRKIDEDAQKAAEAKAIEEGRIKEVVEKQASELEQLRRFKESKDAEEAALRQLYLAKLSDDVRGIAEALPTDKLLAFVDMQSTRKSAPSSLPKGGPAESAETSVTPLPGEKPEAYAARMKKLGKVR